MLVLKIQTLMQSEGYNTVNVNIEGVNYVKGDNNAHIYIECNNAMKNNNILRASGLHTIGHNVADANIVRL